MTFAIGFALGTVFGIVLLAAGVFLAAKLPAGDPDEHFAAPDLDLQSAPR